MGNYIASLAWLSWVAPLAVALVNLALTSKLVSLQEKIMSEVRKEFEPRESCALRHQATDACLIRIEKALEARG